jgi:RNA polymerase primary sigma factor
MKDKQFSIGLDQKQIAYYLKDVKKLKVMTPERERELSEIMCSGNVSEEQKNSIYQELIDGNLRFVITVAKQYQNQGMDLDDLIAEGNVGLLKAIQNFDWTKKLRY